ncbi:MAG: hypothetical protein ACR2FM_02345 [Candidatus Saccharimonadales bacterium]
MNESVAKLKTLQQRISAATWAITLLLSLRGLFIFYGMKDKGSIEQIITFMTEPIVQLFRFDRIESIGIPAIGVLFAAISLLLISNIIQITLRLTELRLARARRYVFHQAVRSK